MKHFFTILSLFSLLAMPVASSAKPTIIPPGQLKKATVQINQHTTSTNPVKTTSTNEKPKTTSTPRVVKVDFNLTGEIVSVNASSSVLEVKIKTINHFSTRRDFRNKTVMIKVSADTSIKMSGGKNKNVTLADLGSGQKVTIKGQVLNEQFSATSIVAAGKPGKAKGILKILNIFKK